MKSRTHTILFILLLLWAPFSVDAQSNTRSHGVDGILTQYCTRLIDLDQKSDSANYLRNYTDDSLSSLFDMLFKRAFEEKLKVYSNCCDTLKGVRRSELPFLLADRLDEPDTALVSVLDPITGVEVQRIRMHCEPNTNSFLVAEEWHQDLKTGRIQAKIVSLAPVFKFQGPHSSDRYSKPLFWMQYTDIKSIIDLYEQYNPLNTLSEHIWNDYFLSDKKPTPIK